MNKKIRVLHTFNIMNRGGAETFVMNVFRNINRDCFTFDFLCENPNIGKFDEEIKNLGGTIYHLSPQKKRPINNIKNIKNFLKKNGPFDVIHIPNSFYSGIYCIAAKKAGIKKIIVHSHSAGDLKKSTLFRKIYIKIMRYLINKYADVKISCGLDAAVFLFGNTNNVIIMNNGIDLKSFNKKIDINEYKKEFKIKNEKVIANIARFSPEKNQMFFIELAKYIKREKLNYKILLIGDGELKPYIQEEISKNDLNSIVICTGLRTDVNHLLEIVDVVVMPSIYEGFPVSVVESLASGTPCVLSDNVDKKTALIPDIVRFVGLDESCKVWMTTINELLKKKIEKKEIVDVLIKEGFDINTSTKLLEKIYSNKN